MLTKERKVGGEGGDKVDQGLVGDRPASLHVEDNQVEQWEEEEAENWRSKPASTERPREVPPMRNTDIPNGALSLPVCPL